MAKANEEDYNENEELESLEDLIAQANAEFEDDDNDEKEESESDNKEEQEEEESNDDESENETDDNEESDEQDEEKEDDSDEDEKEDKKEVNTFEPIMVKVNGIDVTISSKEEMMAFIKKGADSFKVNEDTLTTEKSIIEQGKLTAEDLRLLVDAKNGNAKAIAKLAKASNVDLLDLDENDADAYTPEFAPRQETDVDKVAREIMSNQDLHQKFISVTKSIPSDFINKISTNANDLRTFSGHVESGLAQAIIPDAIKLTYQGYDFATAYVKVGEALVAKQQQQAQQQEQGNNNMSTQNTERQISDREKNLRQKAKEKSSNKSGKQKELSEDDIWNMSKEDFDKLTSSSN